MEINDGNRDITAMTLSYVRRLKNDEWPVRDSPRKSVLGLGF